MKYGKRCSIATQYIQRRISTRSLRKGALIEETYAICRAWDLGAGYATNIDLIRSQNVVGAANRAWLGEVVVTFSQRFPDADAVAPLVTMAQGKVALETWSTCLLYHIAARDALYFIYATDFLFPAFAQGTAFLRTSDVLPFVSERLEAMVAAGKLSETGRTFVARDLLRMSADFGLLTKGNTRQFRQYHVSSEGLLYILHALVERESSAFRAIEAPEWRIYLMTPADVEHGLLRLHQYQILHYQAAGSIVDLKLPYKTLLQYAESIAHG